MAGLKGKKHRKSVEHDRSHEDGELFDLLPSNKKCDTLFRVAFDYYSPRPHFIIVPRDRKSITSYNSLYPEAKLKMVEAAMEMVPHYKLQQSGILSFHFESWLTEKNNFLAHCCADVETYLSIFEKNKDGIPNWPSPKNVTREWKASRDHRHYAINVQQYPFKICFKYELKDIKQYRQTKSLSMRAADACAIPPPPFTAILYHLSEPKVGFAVEKSIRLRSGEALLEAQQAIIKFAEQSKLTNMYAKDGNDGCHVCLVLDEKAHGFNVKDSQLLVGYIQVTGLKFYRDLCPHEKQDDWFTQFSRMKDYKVYT